jgi:hypothetical protein
MEFFNMLCYFLAAVGFTMLVIDSSVSFLYSKRLGVKVISALFLIPSAVLAFSAINHLVN